MQKKRYVPSALAAAVLAGLALGGTAMPAVAATTDAPPAPRFVNVAYDGQVIHPGDHDEVAIGTTREPVFLLSTSVSKGRVSVKEHGREICSASTTSGGGGGFAICKATAPMGAGHHELVATVKSAAGTSAKSDKLSVDAYEDGTGSGATDPATPDPGETDPGFTPPGQQPVDPAIPNPGETDPGFDAGSGVPAPVVKLGEASGDRQQILLALPKETGTINVYDASGNKVLARPYDLGGSELGIWLDAPFGAKTEYSVEYDLSGMTGTTPRTPVTIDRTSGVVDAPTFAFEPGYYGADLLLNLRGIPGATMTATNSATGKTVSGTVDETGGVQLQAGVAANALNEYSIVQTVGGVDSASLTHVVDKRTQVSPEQPAVEAPDGVDGGFSPIEDPADKPATPVTGPIDQGFSPIANLDDEPATPVTGPIDQGFSPISDPITSPTVPSPGDADAGFSPIADPDPKPATPEVINGKVSAIKSEGSVLIRNGATNFKERFVIKTDDGKEHRFLPGTGATTYTFPVTHIEDQDVEIWRTDGDKKSDVVTFHLKLAYS